MSTTTLEQENTTTPIQPPEETVWQRYSPHNEAPLSSLGSFVLHALVIGLVLIAGLIAGWLGYEKKRPPIAVSVGQLVQGGDGLATGQPGAPGGPNGKEGEKLKEDLKNPMQPRVNDPDVKQEKLDASQIATLPQEIRNDPFLKEYIARGDLNLDIFNKVGLQMRLSPLPPADTGGKGQPTGTGPGGQQGMGGTGASGSGSIINDRGKRQLRWKMMFNTQSGEHYVAQLSSLGTILGIPKTPRGGDYWLVRDLNKRPVKLLDEDWTSLNRIQWTDSSPKSARDIAMTTGLLFVPTHFIAFMPGALELKLADLEKKFRGLEEDQIFETEFNIIRVGGVYEPQVTRQVPR